MRSCERSRDMSISARWDERMLSSPRLRLTSVSGLRVHSRTREAFFSEIFHVFMFPRVQLCLNSPVFFPLLSHEKKQVCCFVLQEVCFEMKKLTQCEINREQVLGCSETAPALFKYKRSDSCLAHNIITSALQWGMTCSSKLAHTHRNTRQLQFLKAR